MNGSLMRAVVVALTLACLTACAYETGPAGVPTASSVNPITGTRGGGR